MALRGASIATGLRKTNAKSMASNPRVSVPVTTTIGTLRVFRVGLHLPIDIETAQTRQLDVESHHVGRETVIDAFERHPSRHRR